MMQKAKSRGGTSTADAVLGLLSIAPMSGYTMRSVISQSIGHFWSESFGQIYPALRQLTAKGLVEKKTERQKGRPDRHVYSLTAKGKERLKQWLIMPPADAVPRNELLLKLFFGSHAPIDVSRDNVRALIARQEAALKIYAGIRSELKKSKAEDPQLPFWLMTLSYGSHYSEAMVQWGRETLKQLDAMESSEKEQGRRRTR
jgi:DNA-binding PadR family transcriptional regulator